MRSGLVVLLSAMIASAGCKSSTDKGASAAAVQASPVPAEEKAYLRAMFQVLDQAVAVRVATMQDFSNARFERMDADAEYELLIKYTRGMAVPPKLAAYHKHILVALDQEKYFFRIWRTQGEGF